MSVDYEGHVLSAADYFTTNQQVMVAYVPMQGVHTIYATIGDLFAWLSIAGLVVLTGFAFVRRRQVVEAERGAPISTLPIESVPTSSELTEPRSHSEEPIDAILITPKPTSGGPSEASST